MNATAAKIHKFEAADLGKAPYTLVSVEMREQDPNGPRCGTSCDYCDTYITNVFHCISADGKRFVIGSTCVEKLGDAGLIKAVNEKVREHRRDLRQKKWQAEWEAGRPAREAQQRKEAAEAAARKNQAEADYQRAVEILETQPHPNAHFASKGKTMLDYLRFFEERYGKGSFKVLQIVHKALS